MSNQENSHLDYRPHPTSSGFLKISFLVAWKGFDQLATTHNKFSTSGKNNSNPTETLLIIHSVSASSHSPPFCLLIEGKVLQMYGLKHTSNRGSLLSKHRIMSFIYKTIYIFLIISINFFHGQKVCDFRRRTCYFISMFIL